MKSFRKIPRKTWLIREIARLETIQLTTDMKDFRDLLIDDYRTELMEVYGTCYDCGGNCTLIMQSIQRVIQLRNYIAEDEAKLAQLLKISPLMETSIAAENMRRAISGYKDELQTLLGA